MSSGVGPRERDFRWRLNAKGDLHFLDKKWTYTGIAIGAIHILLLVLGILEFIFAATWDHAFGVFVALMAYAVTLAGLVALLTTNHCVKLTRWWRLAVWLPSLLFLLYLIILLSIRWAAPDQTVDAFPLGCRRTTNCCRLTTLNGTNSQADGLVVPVLSTSLDTVSALVSTWVDSFSNTADLQQAYNDTLFQVRFVSTAFGFPDDFYVGYSCNGSQAVVWVQSESRLGIGDFGVNRARVVSFLSFLSHSTIPAASCGAELLHIPV